MNAALASWSGSWQDLSFQWTGKWDAVGFLVMAMFAIVCISMFVGFAALVQPYMRANLAGVQLSMIDLIGMRLRRVKPRQVIDAKIAAKQAGIDVTLAELQTHVLAGGDPARVVGQIMRAKSAGTPMSWEHAAGCDLAGLDPLKAARK